MDSIARWYSNERGITADTLKAFRIEYDDTQGLLFPYPNAIRYRGVTNNTPDRTFRWDKGSTIAPFLSPNFHDSAIAYIVEGESDCMKLWQEFNSIDDPVAVAGLPGAETWKDAWATLFASFEQIYVILDNDQDYLVRAQVERGWQKIRASLGHKVRRLKLPEDYKDVCEFLRAHSINSLMLLHQQSRSYYAPLDLSKQPLPPHWMVDHLLANGDVAMLQGEPGLGKSYVSLDLALSVAGKSDSWLGRAVGTHGRVLYVDQENPEDEVYNRLRKLGATQTAKKNLRYLHFQGIRLDRDPATFFDEVYDYEPQLVILDSLTRVHTEDENSAGAMAKLFNDGILPIARETGATILIIHHVSKTDASSGFRRSRGSSDIPANLDAGLDLQRANDGALKLILFKSRRMPEGATTRFRIVDRQGGVKLEPVEFYF